jgi:hypothetical protein
MTEYLVLELHSEALWREVGEYESVSAKAAIKKMLSEASISEEKVSQFVAVPARSWQPVKVQVETALKFS